MLTALCDEDDRAERSLSSSSGGSGVPYKPRVGCPAPEVTRSSVSCIGPQANLVVIIPVGQVETVVLKCVVVTVQVARGTTVTCVKVWTIVSIDGYTYRYEAIQYLSNLSQGGGAVT